MNEMKNSAANSGGKSKIRNDIILISALLLIAGAVFLIYTFVRPAGKTAVVRVNGEIVGAYPLSVDTAVEISAWEGREGGRNLLVVENGEAYMAEADCPDLICVHHAPISLDGDTIVCLPNRVVVSVE